MRSALYIVLAAGCVALFQTTSAQDTEAAENADDTPVAVAADDADGGLSASPAGETASALPRDVHAGTVKSVERRESAVDWVNLDNRLLAGKPEPELDVPPDAIEQRPPAEGMCFVIVTVRLADGRSISRYDYRLRAGGTLVPCLALSIAGRPFDIRQWKYALPGEVRLLFECPADAPKANLEFALDSRIPQPTIAGITLIEEPEPAAAPVQTATQAEEQVDADETDAQAETAEANPEAPAPKKETKADRPGPAEKEPKPEPTPAKNKEPEKEPPPKEEPKKEKPKDDGALFF
jgi:hypothetical protein